MSPSAVVLNERHSPALLVVYTLATFGLIWVLIALARLLHDPLLLVDEHGLTTRRGRRLPWAELVDARTIVEYPPTVRRRPTSWPTSWRIEFSFPTRRVALSPQLYTNGWQAVECIEQRLARTFGRPQQRQDHFAGTSRSDPASTSRK